MSDKNKKGVASATCQPLSDSSSIMFTPSTRNPKRKEVQILQFFDSTSRSLNLSDLRSGVCRDHDTCNCSHIYNSLTAPMPIATLSSRCSNDLPKRRDQRLCQPETEHQLRPRHQQLRRQTLEETRDAFLPHHRAHNLEPRLRVLEISVLDTGFDDVEGSGDDERSRSAGDGGDEVLEVGGGVVVGEVVEIFFGEGGTTEKLIAR